MKNLFDTFQEARKYFEVIAAYNVDRFRFQSMISTAHKLTSLCAYIRNGVDVSQYTKRNCDEIDDVRRKLDLPLGKVIYVYSGGFIDRKYFEDNKYITSKNVDFGYDWEVHPAYRWALQPEDPLSIFNELELNIN